LLIAQKGASSVTEMDGTSIVRRPPFGTNPLVGERGTDTQRRILNAALEVFAEVGYNDTRVELITERAGCSRPAFYQYFSSKDDVFWKLAGQLGKEMVALGDQLGPITPDAAGVAALARWIDDFTTLYAAYSPVFEAFQAASRDHKPLARGSSTISERLGAALLRSFGADASGAGVGTLATAVVAVLIRCSFYWENLASGPPRTQAAEGLAEIVHRLFAGPIARPRCRCCCRRRSRAHAAAQRGAHPPEPPRRGRQGAAFPWLPRRAGGRHRGGRRRLARQLLPVLREQGRLLPGTGRSGEHEDDRAPRRLPGPGRAG